jgi:type 1 fimbria pilin
MKIYTKTIILTLILVFAAISVASAATLVWNDSTGTVNGYKIHYGASATNHPNTVDVGSTTQYSIDTLPLSENTQYYFCISAYNSAGESERCAPVAYTPADTTPPAPPVGLSVE